MRNIDVGLLRTLVTIVKTGSFSDAASHLHLTQPAVSHQMHRLEGLLGISLFQTQGRGRVLTRDGQRLVRYASQVLGLNDEIFRVFKDGGLQGVIRIGSPHDVVETILPALLKYARSALPQVKLEVCIDRGPRLMERLVAGDIDMTIATRFDQELEGLILRRSPTVWLCASDYVHDARSPVPLILADGLSIYREMALAALQQSHARWEIIQEVPDLVGIKALVRAGLGVTPRSIDLLSPDMRTLGSKDGLPALPDITYHLWIRPHSANPLVRSAYEQLRHDWELVDVQEVA